MKKNDLEQIKSEHVKKRYKEPYIKKLGSVLKVTQQVKLASIGDNAQSTNQKAVS